VAGSSDQGNEPRFKFLNLKSNQACLKVKNSLNLKVFVLPYFTHVPLCCKAYFQPYKHGAVNL
jgi:hypothetical protein